MLDIDMFKKALGMALVIVGLTYLASAQIYSANDHIVINEVQIEGVSSADDFIELYNPTESEINLDGYRLVKRTESGTSDSSIKAFGSSDVIAAHGYYLWANGGGSYATEADSTTGATISPNNGIALRNGAMDGGEIVDSVGWGSAVNVFVETAAFANNPEANVSMERSGEDTDNNSVDFVLNESPTPQASQAGGQTTPTVSPTPTETATPTPTPSPSPTASATPTASPTIMPTATPTPSPSATPTPTPSSKLRYLGSFGYGMQRTTCYLRYEIVRIGFMKVRFPSMECAS